MAIFRMERERQFKSAALSRLGLSVDPDLVQVWHRVPLVGPDGKALLDEHGRQQFALSPGAMTTEDAAAFIRQEDERRAIAPEQVASALVAALKAGQEAGRRLHGQSVSPTSEITARPPPEDPVAKLKTDFLATEREFERERQRRIRALTNMSPEEKLKEVDSWRNGGLFDFYDLEPLRRSVLAELQRGIGPPREPKAGTSNPRGRRSSDSAG